MKLILWFVFGVIALVLLIKGDPAGAIWSLIIAALISPLFVDRR